MVTADHQGASWWASHIPKVLLGASLLPALLVTSCDSVTHLGGPGVSRGPSQGLEGGAGATREALKTAQGQRETA